MAEENLPCVVNYRMGLLPRRGFLMALKVQDDQSEEPRTLELAMDRGVAKEIANEIIRILALEN